MPNDFSLADWYALENPKPEKKYEVKDFNRKEMLLEASIHEAGHLVLGILLTRLNLGFTQCTGIFVEVTNEFTTGRVSGFIPDAGDYDLKGARDWYRDKPVRIWVKLFSTLVGYVTYKSFFLDDQYFISCRTDDNQEKTKVHYYNLQTALKENTFFREDPRVNSISKIHDLYLANKYCKLLGIQTTDERLELCNEIIEDLLDLLSKGAIISSIGFIKNRLLEEKTVKKEIKGESLREIIDKVDKFTKNVSLLDLAQKYLDKYKNHVV